MAESCCDPERLHVEEVLRGELASGGSDMAYYAIETLEWMLRQLIIGANGPKIRVHIKHRRTVLSTRTFH